MPRLARQLLGRAQRLKDSIPETDLEDELDEAVREVYLEAKARDEHAYSLVRSVVSHMRNNKVALPTGSWQHADAGLWPEARWVWLVREMHAIGIKPIYLEARQHRGLCDQPALDAAKLAELHKLEPADRAAAVRQLAFAPLSHQERTDSLRHYHVLTHVRPHGFASVGRLEPSSPLGRLLLHGVGLFLESSCSSGFAHQLGSRFERAASIGHPMAHYCAARQAYRGEALLVAPPLAAQVPVFDLTSLSQQLDSVLCVVQGLLLPGYALPPDNVQAWAAFNKLLALGLLAAIEEAAAVPSGAAALARQQAAALAAAREVEAQRAPAALQAAAGAFRLAARDLLDASLTLGQSSLQALAAQQPQPGEAAQQLESAQQAGGGPQQLWTAHSGEGAPTSEQQAALRLLCGAGVSWGLQMRAALQQPAQAAAAEDAALGAAPQQLLALLGSDNAGAAPDAGAGLEQLLSRLMQLLVALQPGGGSSGEQQEEPPLRDESGVELQATLSLLLQLLTLKLLDGAPPCTSWTPAACFSLLKLQLAAEKARGYAAHLAVSAACDAPQPAAAEQPAAAPGSPLSSAASQAPREQLDPQPRGPSCQQALMHACVEAVTHARLLRDELADRASGWSPPAGGAPQRISANSGGSSGGANSGSSSSSGRAGAASQDTLWRAQTLAHYKSQRASGLAALGRHFADVSCNNSQPGFWGLVHQFAGVDTLNLRRRQDPELAAVASWPWWTRLPRGALEPGEGHGPELARTAVLSRGLARAINWQPPSEMQEASILAPVLCEDLVQLLRLACIAASLEDPQRPSCLPYCNLAPGAAGAAANGASSSGSDSCDAEAVARQAERAWCGAAAHLGVVAGLAPLFAQGQQGPCLARLLQLLAQYSSSLSAATQHAAVCMGAPAQPAGSLAHVPDAAPCSGPGSSRLLVLLMGLWHLRMLEKQQLQRAQAAGSGSSSSCSSSSSSDAASPYSSLEQRVAACSAAAGDALDVADLLLFCCCDDPACLPGPAAERASSSAGRFGLHWLAKPAAAPARPLPATAMGVCDLAAQLTYSSGYRLLSAMPDAPHLAGWPKVAPLCDACCAQASDAGSQGGLHEGTVCPNCKLTAACSKHMHAPQCPHSPGDCELLRLQAGLAPGTVPTESAGDQLDVTLIEERPLYSPLWQLAQVLPAALRVQREQQQQQQQQQRAEQGEPPCGPLALDVQVALLAQRIQDEPASVEVARAALDCGLAQHLQAKGGSVDNSQQDGDPFAPADADNEAPARARNARLWQAGARLARDASPAGPQPQHRGAFYRAGAARQQQQQQEQQERRQHPYQQLRRGAWAAHPDVGLSASSLLSGLASMDSSEDDQQLEADRALPGADDARRFLERMQDCPSKAHLAQLGSAAAAEYLAQHSAAQQDGSDAGAPLLGERARELLAMPAPHPSGLEPEWPDPECISDFSDNLLDELD